MRKMSKISSGIAIAMFFNSFPIFSQTVPINGKAKVIAFEAPYHKIKLDMTADKTEFIQEFSILPTTRIIDKNNKAVGPELIKAGSELILTGKKAGYSRSADEIKVTFFYTGDEIKIEGLLEKYDQLRDYGVIKGERIKLVPGVKIKGISRVPAGPYKFSEITIGNKMEVTGSRKDDGFIHASRAVVMENVFTDDDKALMDVMSRQFSSANIDSINIPDDQLYLSRGFKSAPVGHVNFGDAQYKLDTSKYLQMFVNYVGNKVVPAYIREIPLDAPEKINFRFFVIDNPVFNAFGLPNGMVFISSALLAQIDNEAQLAAILGHEISHVIYKHAKKRYEGQQKLKAAIAAYYGASSLYNIINTGNLNEEQKKKSPDEENIDIAVMILYAGLQGNFQPAIDEAQTLLPVIGKIPPASKKAVLGMLYGLRGLASNDHDSEKEDNADGVGLFYMKEAGYDPREASKIWEKFMTMTLSAGNVMEKLNMAAKDWVINSNMYDYKNPISQAGDMVVSKLISAATDNWFSNYPKASERFRNLNLLVSSYYMKDDLSKSIVGTEEYAEVKRIANQTLSRIKY